MAAKPDLAEILSHINESSRVKLSLIDQAEKISQIVTTLATTIKQGGRIYACGNGGSACDAMHLVEELVARYQRERPGIRAQHLLDTGTITCWANDYTFDEIFERQVNTLLTKLDALVVFTTSGNSQNILRALAAANKLGATTIALLGKNGGAAKSLSKLSLIVGSEVTAHIQESHITLVHIICDQLEQLLFPELAQS